MTWVQFEGGVHRGGSSAGRSMEQLATLRLLYRKREMRIVAQLTPPPFPGPILAHGVVFCTFRDALSFSAKSFWKQTHARRCESMLIPSLVRLAMKMDDHMGLTFPR